MQGTWVQSLRKILHAMDRLTPMPQPLSLCSGAREPQLLSLRAPVTEAGAPSACAMQ